MNSVNNRYRKEGIKKIIAYGKVFSPHEKQFQSLNTSIIDNFINTFCEYELADNNYMPLFQQTNLDSNTAFQQLSTEDVLKYLTYIIWTDRVADNYFLSRVRDNTVHQLIERLSEIES
ncbi:hypothetical protein ACI6Q2_16665 [Chitinophagaceae bacterium LWZ2-11]